MEEEGTEDTNLASQPISREELQVLTTRHQRFIDQLRTQKRFITSELTAQDDRISELQEKNQVLQTKVKTLTRKTRQQEQQIASITSQVHLLTNQVDFLMARLRQQEEQEQQEHQEQQEEQQQAQGEHQGNIVQE